MKLAGQEVSPILEKTIAHAVRPFAIYAALALAGCFSPTFPEGVLCTLEDRRCPGDQICASDDRCYNSLPSDSADAANADGASSGSDSGSVTCNPRVAFAVPNAARDSGNVFLVLADGTELVNLTQTDGVALFPSWSPDGKSLGLVENSQLTTRSIESGDVTLLTTQPSNISSPPKWSPDGRQLLFTTSGTFTVIQFVNVNEMVAIGTPVPVVASIFRFNPRWSDQPDRISYGTSTDIFTVNLDGTNLSNLSNTGNASGAAWSPDKQRIAHIRNVGNSEVFVMNADGSNAQNISGNPSRDGPVEWSPDGRLLFVSDRSGHDELYIMNSDGSGLSRLTVDSGTRDAKLGAWSPNSDVVAYVRAGATPSSSVLIAINVSTREETILMNNLADPSIKPAWEPCPSP